MPQIDPKCKHVHHSLFRRAPGCNRLHFLRPTGFITGFYGSWRSNGALVGWPSPPFSRSRKPLQTVSLWRLPSQSIPALSPNSQFLSPLPSGFQQNWLTEPQPQREFIGFISPNSERLFRAKWEQPVISCGIRGLYNFLEKISPDISQWSHIHEGVPLKLAPHLAQCQWFHKASSFRGYAKYGSLHISGVVTHCCDNICVKGWMASARSCVCVGCVYASLFSLLSLKLIKKCVVFLFLLADTRDTYMGQGAKRRADTESKHIHWTFQQDVVLDTVTDTPLWGA